MRMNIGIGRFVCSKTQPATFFENWFLMFVVWVDTKKAGLLLVNLPLLYMFVGCLFPDAKMFKNISKHIFHIKSTTHNLSQMR